MKRVAVTTILFVMGLSASLTACSPRDKADPAPAAGASHSSDDDRLPVPMLAFACGSEAPYLAIFGIGGDPVTLLTPAEIRTLQPVPTRSGAKSAGAKSAGAKSAGIMSAGNKYADDKYVLWAEGTEVRLTISGVPAEGCRTTGRQAVLARAWSHDVVFLAMGQEPGWSLLATDYDVTLTTGYGQVSRTFPRGLENLPGGLYPTGKFNLRDAQGEVVVHLTAGPCRDVMSGEPYAVEVTIEAGKNHWTGCGLSFR